MRLHSISSWQSLSSKSSQKVSQEPSLSAGWGRGAQTLARFYKFIYIFVSPVFYQRWLWVTGARLLPIQQVQMQNRSISHTLVKMSLECIIFNFKNPLASMVEVCCPRKGVDRCLTCPRVGYWCLCILLSSVYLNIYWDVHHPPWNLVAGEMDRINHGPSDLLHRDFAMVWNPGDAHMGFSKLIPRHRSQTLLAPWGHPVSLLSCSLSLGNVARRPAIIT